MSAADRVTRTVSAELEFRGTDGRTIVGLAAPFDRPATVVERGRTFRESIRRGAFARTIAERGDRVKALASHDLRSLPIGRAARLWEDQAGLWAELAISSTRQGDEVLALAHDGALDGLSVGMEVLADHWTDRGQTREVREAKLHEISLVAVPAYDTARVTAVRTAAPAHTLDLARRRLDLATATRKDHR